MINQHGIITCWRNILITPRRKEEATPLLLKYEGPNRQDARLNCVVENYFFFGGETAEGMTPEEYKENVPEEDILKEIHATLDDFNETEAFCYVLGKGYHNNTAIC